MKSICQIGGLLDKFQAANISGFSRLKNKSTGRFGISRKNHLNHPRGFSENIFLKHNFCISQKIRFFQKNKEFFEKNILFLDFIFHFFLADG